MDISTLDWKSHSHIGLDLDETLAATMSGMLSYAHSIGKLAHLHTIEQITTHDASGLGSDTTPEEAKILWEDYGKSTLLPSSVPPLDHSIHGVRMLHTIGKNLSIVTARSDKESWKVERTKNWIRSYFSFLGDDDIHFVNHFSDDARPKSEICKKIAVSLMIDDALENVYELCENRITCILLEKPWNRTEFDHPLLYRAKDWKDIIESIHYAHS